MENNTITTYINPLTDFGFKFIFGRYADKEFILSFLNAVIGGNSPITNVKFIDKEKKGESKDDRALIYDLHCELEDGSKIIVEMQTKTYGEDGNNTSDIHEGPGFSAARQSGEIRCLKRQGQGSLQGLLESLQG